MWVATLAIVLAAVLALVLVGMREKNFKDLFDMTERTMSDASLLRMGQVGQDMYNASRSLHASLLVDYLAFLKYTKPLTQLFAYALCPLFAIYVHWTWHSAEREKEV